MNNKRYLFFAGVMVFFFATGLFAQSFNLNGNGARAAGMGYAFTGVADDASAIAWNSAGLTQLESMEASVIGRFGFGSASKDYDPGTGIGWSDGTSNYFLEVQDANYDLSSNFNLNFASFVVPFSIGSFKIVGGVAYRNLYDFAEKGTFTAKGELSNWDNGTILNPSSVYINDYEYSGGVNAISPSVAIAFNDMLSVGVTYNIISGQYGKKSIETLDGSELSNYDRDDVIDFSGGSLDVGILMKFGSMIRVGGNLNFGHTLTWDFNEYNYTADLSIPMFYSIGIGLNFGDNFLLGLDYHSRPWSSAEWQDDNTMFSDYDINSVHIGMEYLVFLGNIVMPFRLGYYTQPTLNTDANGDQISSNRFTGGLGFVLGNIVLDAAIEYGNVSYLSTKFDSGEEINYSKDDFLLTLGATFHFGQ